MSVSTHTITITGDAQGCLQTGCDTTAIGRLDDNNSIRLEFERPRGYEGYDLTIFLGDGADTTRLDLGAANALLLSRAYTQGRYLAVMPAFFGENGFRRSASTLYLKLGDILDGSAAPPEPWPDPILNLNANAWYGPCEDMGDYLSVKNNRGEEVARLPAGGGGGVSKTYADLQDAATLTAAEAYTDAASAVLEQAVAEIGGQLAGRAAKPLTDTQEQLVHDAALAGLAAYGPGVLTLAVMTDLHWTNRADTDAPDYKSDPRAFVNCHEMLAAAAAGPTDAIVMLGDWQNSYVSRAATLSAMPRFARALNGPKPVFPLRGNHDDNSDVNRTPGYVIPAEEWYAAMCAPFQNGAVHDPQRPNSLYYYRDFEDKKIRCIFLDFIDYPAIVQPDGTLKYAGGRTNGETGMGFSAGQVRWLAGQALNFSGRQDADEWTVVVLCHGREIGKYHPSDTARNGDIIFGILDAFNRKAACTGVNSDADWGVSVDVDFSADATGGILCYLMGHFHRDFVLPPGADSSDAWLRNPYSFHIIGVGNGFRSANGYCQLVSIDPAARTLRTHSICDNTALDTGGNYTRSREIDLSSQPAPDRLPLTQGSYTYRGVTVTVSGNTITLNGTVETSPSLEIQQRWVKITDGFATSSDNLYTRAPEAWINESLYYVGAGTTGIRFRMTNVSGSASRQAIEPDFIVAHVYYTDRLQGTAGIPTLSAPVPATTQTARTDCFGAAAICIGRVAGDTWNNYTFDLEGYAGSKRIL